MKTWLLSFGVIVLTVFLQLGCSSSINNSITFKNLSDGDIFINFRGSEITVAAGQTTVVSNIPKGTYNYSTTYTVPAGVTGSSAQGNMSGTVTLNAGTKIQLIYASIILNGTYTISVTVSDSDKLSTSANIAFPGQNERKTNTNLTGP
jgi:hypothetical protein